MATLRRKTDRKSMFLKGYQFIEIGRPRGRYDSTGRPCFPERVHEQERLGWEGEEAGEERWPPAVRGSARGRPRHARSRRERMMGDPAPRSAAGGYEMMNSGKA